MIHWFLMTRLGRWVSVAATFAVTLLVAFTRGMRRGRQAADLVEQAQGAPGALDLHAVDLLLDDALAGLQVREHQKRKDGPVPPSSQRE